MTPIIERLPAALRPQSEKILAEISVSGSTIDVVKSGAQAYGFVLGLKCGGAIDDQQADQLAEFFDKTTELTLKKLTLGLS